MSDDDWDNDDFDIAPLPPGGGGGAAWDDEEVKAHCSPSCQLCARASAWTNNYTHHGRQCHLLPSFGPQEFEPEPLPPEPGTGPKLSKEKAEKLAREKAAARAQAIEDALEVSSHGRGEESVGPPANNHFGEILSCRGCPSLGLVIG